MLHFVIIAGWVLSIGKNLRIDDDAAGGFHKGCPVNADGFFFQRKFGIKKKGQLQRLVGVRGIADVHLLQTWFAPADEGGKLPFDAGKFGCAERCAKGAEIRHAEVLIKHGVALPGIENAGQVIGHGLDDVRCFHGIALVALLPGMAQPFQKAQS